jgi:hypothetical protein
VQHVTTADRNLRINLSIAIGRAVELLQARWLARISSLLPFLARPVPVEGFTADRRDHLGANRLVRLGSTRVL